MCLPILYLRRTFVSLALLVLNTRNYTLRLALSLFVMFLCLQITGQAREEAQEFFFTEFSEFHKQTQLSRQGRLAVVMSRRFPSTETYDFQVHGGQSCVPSTDWNRRLQWNSGSCVDTNGDLHRFIETFSEDGEVMYFRCDAFGVSPRSLINAYHSFAIGNPAYGENVTTKVIVKGREVGTYPGRFPNVFVVGDIRRIITDNGESLFDRIRSGEGGVLKFETTQKGKVGTSFYKFSLKGFKRAIKWCTANLDEMVARPVEGS